jgi:hypothetical protein
MISCDLSVKRIILTFETTIVRGYVMDLLSVLTFSVSLKLKVSVPFEQFTVR